MKNISLESVSEFLEIKKKGAKYIAGAVAMCILCPAVLILFAGLADSHIWNISEGFAVAVGMTVLLVLVAAAVSIFIFYGITWKKFEYMETEDFNISNDLIKMIQEKEKKFKNIFAMKIALGTVLCIISILPLIIAGAIKAADYICCAMISVLLIFVAIGVFMIIESWIINRSYHVILKEGEFSRGGRKGRRKLKLFGRAYWCIVTAIYLAGSFLTMRWDFTWIIWPITGVLFAALSAIMHMILTDVESEF